MTVLMVGLISTPAWATDDLCNISLTAAMDLVKHVEYRPYGSQIMTNLIDLLPLCYIAQNSYGVRIAAFSPTGLGGLYLAMGSDEDNTARIQSVADDICRFERKGSPILHIRIAKSTDWFGLKSLDQLDKLEVKHTIDCDGNKAELIN